MQITAEMYQPVCRRRSERRRPRAMATFGQGLQRIFVEVTDLSLEGLRITSPIPVLPGTHIWLKMPLLACRQAIVVWCDGTQMGCQFADPLHPMMFDTLTRARGNDSTLMPGRRDNDKVVAGIKLSPGPRQN